MKGINKFFHCTYCGNLAALIEDMGPSLVCCGEDMEALTANSVDAAVEKHVPVASVLGDKLSVEVGSVAHPMTDDHYITFVYVGSESGGQRKALNPGMEPKADFCFTNDKPLKVYAYCNLHGLWEADL